MHLKPVTAATAMATACVREFMACPSHGGSCSEPRVISGDDNADLGVDVAQGRSAGLSLRGWER